MGALDLTYSGRSALIGNPAERLEIPVVTEWGPSIIPCYRVVTEPGQWVIFRTCWGSNKRHQTLITACIAQDNTLQEIPAPKYSTASYTLKGARRVNIPYMRAWLMAENETWDRPELGQESDLRIVIRWLKRVGVREESRKAEPSIRGRIDRVLREDLTDAAKVQEIRRIVGQPFWKKKRKYWE